MLQGLSPGSMIAVTPLFYRPGNNITTVGIKILEIKMCVRVNRHISSLSCRSVTRWSGCQHGEDFTITCGKHHAVGHLAHHFPGLEVGDKHHLAADKVGGIVMFPYPRKDLPTHRRTVIQSGYAPVFPIPRLSRRRKSDRDA